MAYGLHIHISFHIHQFISTYNNFLSINFLCKYPIYISFRLFSKAMTKVSCANWNSIQNNLIIKKAKYLIFVVGFHLSFICINNYSGWKICKKLHLHDCIETQSSPLYKPHHKQFLKNKSEILGKTETLTPHSRVSGVLLDVKLADVISETSSPSFHWARMYPECTWTPLETMACFTASSILGSLKQVD